MQHLAHHVHERCRPTACRYRATVNSQTHIQTTHNLQSKSLNMNKEHNVDKSAKTSRTDTFHNLLNLDSIKDLQLLQSWSVLGYFVSCLSLHIQILVDIINVIKAHSGVGIKTVTCYTLLNNSWLFTKELCTDSRHNNISIIWSNGKICMRSPKRRRIQTIVNDIERN